jgi:hypothetical protein
VCLFFRFLYVLPNNLSKLVACVLSITNQMLAAGSAGEDAASPPVKVQRPRLFCFRSQGAGSQDLATEEVLRFAQSDLFSTEVMLLDTPEELFLWIGAESSPEKQEQAQSAAKGYLSNKSRSAETPITTVRFYHSYRCSQTVFLPQWCFPRAITSWDCFFADRRF